MLDLIDHAAYSWGIFQCPAPMHFIESQTNKGLALIFRTANWAADLGYGYGRIFISHGLMPFLLQLDLLPLKLLF